MADINVLCLVLDDDQNVDGNVEMKGNSDEETEKEDTRLDQLLDICLQTFDCLDLGDNLEIFKKSVRGFIKGSYLSFKPPTEN